MVYRNILLGLIQYMSQTAKYDTTEIVFKHKNTWFRFIYISIVFFNILSNSYSIDNLNIS